MSYPHPVRPWHVTTAIGNRRTTHEVMATTAAAVLPLLLVAVVNRFSLVAL